MNKKEKDCSFRIKSGRSYYCKGDESISCDFKTLYKRKANIDGVETQYYCCTYIKYLQTQLI